jgi:hypothetical protein
MPYRTQDNVIDGVVRQIKAAGYIELYMRRSAMSRCPAMV